MEVLVRPQALRKLEAYLRLAEGEISGFGVVANEEGILIVEDIFILPQVSGAVETELDEDAMQDLLFRLLQDDIDPETISLWWHSHGGSGSYFSSTDDTTIERFAEFGKPWMLNLVSNIDLDHVLRLDIYDPFRLTVEALSLKAITEIDERLDRRIVKEIQEKVRRPPPPAISSRKNGIPGLSGVDIDQEIERFLTEHGVILGVGEECE